MDPSTGGAGLKRSSAFGQHRPPVGGTSRLVETERSQQSSALERHRMKGIPLASCGRSNCFRSFPHHQIQTFLGAFLLIYSPFYAAQTSFKPCSPQTRLRFCSAGLCSFPSSVRVCVFVHANPEILSAWLHADLLCGFCSPGFPLNEIRGSLCSCRGRSTAPCTSPHPRVTSTRLRRATLNILWVSGLKFAAEGLQKQLLPQSQMSA